MNYTQANTDGKKHEMAEKMYKMNGRSTGTSGGMKYKQNAKETTSKGGMKYKQHGPGKEETKGMKYSQSNKDHTFSNNYTQNGKGK